MHDSQQDDTQDNALHAQHDSNEGDELADGLEDADDNTDDEFEDEDEQESPERDGDIEDVDDEDSDNQGQPDAENLTVDQPTAQDGDNEDGKDKDDTAAATLKPTKKRERSCPEFTLRSIVDRANNGEVIPPILKPMGTGGRDFNIRDHIGLGSNNNDDRYWYKEILVSLVYSY